MNNQKLKKLPLSTDQKEISKTVKDLTLADQLSLTAKLLIKHQPKIYKVNNPGWPVVSACSCPTEHISEYLQSLPTYIKDSTYALNLIEDNQNPNFELKHLFTMDVTSLYTCIPHLDGLKALHFTVFP